MIQSIMARRLTVVAHRLIVVAHRLIVMARLVRATSRGTVYVQVMKTGMQRIPAAVISPPDPAPPRR
jgi:hypothetical protein